jgi:hypothetical protein
MLMWKIYFKIKKYIILIYFKIKIILKNYYYQHAKKQGVAVTSNG